MQLFFNNKFYPKNAPIINSESKAFRYGEMVFETIKCLSKELLFFEEHFKRLETAANLLNIYFPPYFNSVVLKLHINSLLQKNNLNNARVKVTIFKGDGGLFDVNVDAFNILIETYELENPKYNLNSNGLDVCFYETFTKNTDALNNYKTGNYLVNSLAATYAKQQKCNDALLLNNYHIVCDSIIANIFVVKNNSIYTPPLTDGSVNGIVRNYLLQLEKNITEKSITKEEVLQADEVFLTNTIKGIMWVKQIENKKYTNSTTVNLFNQYIKPLNK